MFKIGPVNELITSVGWSKQLATSQTNQIREKEWSRTWAGWRFVRLVLTRLQLTCVRKTCTLNKQSAKPINQSFNQYVSLTGNANITHHTRSASLTSILWSDCDLISMTIRIQDRMTDKSQRHPSTGSSSIAAKLWPDASEKWESDSNSWQCNVTSSTSRIPFTLTDWLIDSFIDSIHSIEKIVTRDVWLCIIIC